MTDHHIIATFEPPYVPERPPYRLHALHHATLHAQLHRGALVGGRLSGDVWFMTSALYDYWTKKARKLEGR